MVNDVLSFRGMDSRQRRNRCWFLAAAALILIWSIPQFFQVSPSKYMDSLVGVGNQILPGSESPSAARSTTPGCEKFEEIQALPTKDKCLLAYLKEQVLIPPSTLEYNFSKISTDFPSPYAELLKKTLFPNKTNGFFIEAGANDGEFLSNTLALEREQNWTGLLVEALPRSGEKLLNVHRKAWFADVCLSPFNNVSKISILESSKDTLSWRDALAKLDLGGRRFKYDPYRPFGLVPCFPLVSLLGAMNVTHVDFFSLDVEGVELKVLQTLPFDESLTIDFILVESNLIPEGKGALKSFMLSKGYEVVLDKEMDYIFKRISLN